MMLRCRAANAWVQAERAKEVSSLQHTTEGSSVKLLSFLPPPRFSVRG